MWTKAKKALGVLWDWATVIAVSVTVSRVTAHLADRVGATPPPATPLEWHHVIAFVAWCFVCAVAGYHCARNIAKWGNR